MGMRRRKGEWRGGKGGMREGKVGGERAVL